MLSSLGSWLGLSDRDGKHRPLKPSRRLGYEQLEDRALLSISPGATILGTTFSDHTLNGLTADDTILTNVTVKLYRDGGNGTFQGSGGGSDDTLIATVQSDASGKYQFDSQPTGTYFVQEVPPPSQVLPGGASPATKVVITDAMAQGVVGVPIDSFLTDQVADASSNSNTTANSSIAAPEALGGHRDLLTQLTSGVGEVNLEVNAFDQHLLEYNSTATGIGTRVVSWDGGNGATFNPTGLNHADLTHGGTSTQMSIVIGADHDGGQLTFRVYKDANNWSVATVPVPNTGGAALQTVTIPFASFTVGGGSGAGNFTDVGGVQLQLAGGVAVNGQVSAISTVGPTMVTTNLATYIPASVGNFVFWDLNKNGIQDPSEPGAANVTVQLLQNGAVVATTTTNPQGVYDIDNLVPGSYSLKFITPNGAIFTTQNAGGNPALDSDPNASGATGTFTLASGQDDTTHDAGLVPVDLSITKTVDQPTAAVGSNVTFTITITNGSNYSPATGVSVSDVLPAGLTFVSANAASGTSFNSSSGVWTIGNLASGASKSLTMVATIASGGSKTNNAHVNEADEPDVGSPHDASATVTPPGAVGNLVFWDLNKSGTQDPSEPGAANVTVQLLQNGSIVATTTTNAQGVYNFGSVTPGTYSLKFIPASGVVFTTQNAGGNPALDSDPDASGVTNTFVVVSGEDDTTHDAGLVPVDLSITKVVDQSTAPIGANVTFTITVTNGSGYSQASGVTVNDVLPTGLSLVSSAASAGTSYNGGTGVWTIGSLASGASTTLTIVATVGGGGAKVNNAHINGSNEPDVGTPHDASATVTPPGSIGDLVFWDLNQNGIQDASEPGVEGATVELLHNGATIATTTTNVQGGYSFTNVTPGSYSLKFVTPNGETFTTQNAGGDPAADSDANASGVTSAFTLASGQIDNTRDAGVLPVELSIAKSVNNPVPPVGSTVTFTVTVGNATGVSNATHVTISDLLPAGLAFISDTTTPGSSYDSTTGEWNIDSLPNAHTATLTITAIVTSQGTKTNIAQVQAADQPDVGTVHEAQASVTPPPPVSEVPPLVQDPPKLSKAYFLGR
jgi:uncharacterized repeat protein (TIGR01451 family)